MAASWSSPRWTSWTSRRAWSRVRKAVECADAARLDLPELLLEMHARTRFAAGFTHASEGGARADDVATSLCAVLIVEACNTSRCPTP